MGVKIYIYFFYIYLARFYFNTQMGDNCEFIFKYFMLNLIFNLTPKWKHFENTRKSFMKKNPRVKFLAASKRNK